MTFADKNGQNNVLCASKVFRLECDRVNFLSVDVSCEGQRLDNFLMSIAKGVPKSHIYRVVRKGDVRVNKKRVSVDTRLNLNDIVRIPPLRVSENAKPSAPKLRVGEVPILYEDEHLMVCDKPSGLAAHGGSGVSFGLIEKLRSTRPEAAFLELAHRLDRDTSGVIVVCKTRKALVRFQQMQREGGKIRKLYRLLVLGDWVNDRQHVKLPLKKFTLANGERRVRVDRDEGLFSHTIFTVLRRFGGETLLQAELKTGRTHQIRVHAASLGFPLVCDDKYGDYEVNAAIAKGSLGVPFKRLFLHAYSIAFTHPVTGQSIEVVSQLPSECENLLEVLAKEIS